MVSQITKKKKNSPQLSDRDQEYQILKDKSDFEKKCANWCSTIVPTVQKKCFSSIQFIVSVQVEEFGTQWQKIACKNSDIDPDRAEEFWVRKGQTTARAALNRKSMNTTDAMKELFLSKC
jgi:hypothetical protein